MSEHTVVDVFGAWLEAEGWTVRYEADGAGVVAVRDDETIVAEAADGTPTPGPAVDALYGRLLRRMADYPSGARFAAVVPADIVPAALRVPRQVRRTVKIDVYTVDGQGGVERRWD